MLSTPARRPTVNPSAMSIERHRADQRARRERVPGAEGAAATIAAERRHRVVAARREEERQHGRVPRASARPAGAASQPRSPIHLPAPASIIAADLARAMHPRAPPQRAPRHHHDPLCPAPAPRRGRWSRPAPRRPRAAASRSRSCTARVACTSRPRVGFSATSTDRLAGQRPRDEELLLVAAAQRRRRRCPGRGATPNSSMQLRGPRGAPPSSRG